MFKTAITTLLLGLVLLTGCQRNGPGPVPPTPTPTPGPGPAPGPDDPVPDPSDLEKVVPYSKTVDQIKADMVGHWVTMANNRRWLFTKDDKIELTQVDVDKVDARTVVTAFRINATNPKSPDVVLSGFIKVRYEMIDGSWYLTELLPMGELRPHAIKKDGK